MSDIFICYSRTDSPLAKGVAERLRAQGWSVFLDVQTRVGKRWHKEIERELHAARAVVVLWSAKSRESDYVLEEATYGKDKEVLFPAIIEKVEFPYGFRRIQTADLVGWAGEAEHPGMAKLIADLSLHLNGRKSVPANEGRGDQASNDTRPTVQARGTRFAPGTTFRDKLKCGGEGPLMAVIPAGRFLIGSPPKESARRDSEGPQHEVRIAKPFAMGVYAVTLDDYDRYCLAETQAKPGDRGWGRGKRPVINISWEDAQQYCQWLSEQTQRIYQLPSEALWEYACRAGTDTPFHFGHQITTDQAHFDGNYPYNGGAKGKFRKQTVPVGSFAPNAFGLHDMHGNVWEWCQDEWHDTYVGAAEDGSAWGGSNSSAARVLRGGSWYDDAGGARSSARYYGDTVVYADRRNKVPRGRSRIVTVVKPAPTANRSGKFVRLIEASGRTFS